MPTISGHNCYTVCVKGEGVFSCVFLRGGGGGVSQTVSQAFMLQ
jgi:hypothetical protein